MATESIFHNIVINDRHRAERFVIALEKASQDAQKRSYHHSGSRVLSANEVDAVWPKIKC